MGTLTHFGINIRTGKYGLKMMRDNYAIIDKKCTIVNHSINYYEKYWGEEKRDEFLKIFEDESATTYTDSWCKEKQEKALMNFDLNIKFFKSLNYKDFNSKLNNFLKKNKKFKEIINLNEVSKKGYYLMVLDEYCQVYIGTAVDIKRRIMQHWSKSKEFDRLIFGCVENSKLSIDSFKALDTTRIYAYCTNTLYLMEDNFIQKIPEIYCCNRTGGGIHEYGALNIIANAKYRDFSFK